MKMEAKCTSVLFLALFFLTSCTFNPFISNNHTTGDPAGAAIGAGIGAGSVALLGGSKTMMALTGIGGGAVGYYVTTLRYDSGGIIQGHGQVYQVGEFIGINIPSDNLFEPNTADFLPQARPVLDSISAVLQRKPNNSILISGNTSGFYRSKWEQRLSEKRAQKIASYLWNDGINQFKDRDLAFRKLNYVGYGDYFPISQDYTNDGIRQNSHIQITSYPDLCTLLRGKRDVAMYNMGSTDDSKDISRAGDCCKNSEC